MKDIAPDAIAALERAEAIETAAVAIYCDPPVRVWGGNGTLMLDEGDDEYPYIGLGTRGMVTMTGGAIGGSEQNVVLTLSGVEPEARDLFDAEELRDAPVVIYRMIFDASGTQLLDYRPWKRGRVDKPECEDVVGGDSTITVPVESAARGLGRNNGRMRSDADQRLIDPDDGFFKHCSYAGEKQIYFGGKISAAAKSTG